MNHELQLLNTNCKIRSGKIKVKRRTIESLSLAEIEGCYNLFSRGYTNISRQVFLSDLKEKDYIFLGKDTGDLSVQGFTTIKVAKVNHSGRKVNVIFTGDTMFSPEYWGQRQLNTEFAKFCFWLKLKEPLTPLYWLLICMGYKTYLIMAKNVHKYWPNYREQTPPDIKSLLNTTCQSIFNQAWYPDLGIVRFSQEKASILKEEIAPINQNVLKIPEVNFLIQKNPGYKNGDELACLALLDISSLLNPFFKKLKKRFQLESEIEVSAHAKF